MTSADIHTLTGAYAADALSGAERVEFERHLLACPGCAQEVAELQATAARIGTAMSATPPAGLKSQVMSGISLIRQEPPIVRSVTVGRPTTPVITPPSIPILIQDPHRLRPDDELAVRRSRGTWSRAGLAGLAASMVAAAALGFTTVKLQDDLDQTRSALQDTRGSLEQQQTHAQAITQVLGAPDAHTVAGPVSGGGHGTVVVSHGLSKAVFVGADMPALAPDRIYQMWLISTGGPRSVGIMDVPTAENSVVFGGLGDADKIGVTVEPAGGSKAPTTVPVMLFGLDA